MTPEKKLYLRWIDELWMGAPVAEELVSEDFVGHWPDRDVHGPVELQSIIDETRGMLTNLTFAVEVGPLVEGDLLAARWVGSGQSTDGSTAKFFGNDILRYASGRIIEYWTGTPTG